jgi:Na+-transporting NADH:ubiquinone oxidoreductase subunit NqrE
MDHFFYAVLALAVCTAIVQIVYHFISKRNPLLSQFDKSFRHFVFGTVFYALLVLIALLHLPPVGSDTLTTLGDAPPEIVVQHLVKNQQRLNRELEEFRDVISLVLLTTALYAFAVVGILQRWRTAQKKLLSQGAVQTRPLGLEMD